MTIVVVGHRGFIGSELIRFLQCINTPVIGLSSTDLDIFLRIQKPIDWVFYTAGTSNTREGDREFILDKNFYVVQRWLETACEKCSGLTYLSSGAVYGGIEDCVESGPVDPLNHYAESKVLLDNWSISQDFPIPVQSLRLFHVYGRNEVYKSMPSAIMAIIKRIISNQPIDIWVHRTRYPARDLISIDDVIHLMMSLKALRVRGIYNIGSGRLTTYTSLAYMIGDLLKTKALCFRHREVTPKEAQIMQWNSCANLTKVKKELNDWNGELPLSWLEKNIDNIVHNINKAIY